ncbi:dipeptidase [bacterium]|nr:dipeptidase [bacterium]
MNRRSLTAMLIAICLCLAVSNAAAECPCRAPELMQSFLTIDTHVDIPAGYATEKLDPAKRCPELKVDLVKMAEGGLKCVFLASYTGQGPLTAAGYANAEATALEQIEAIHRLTQRMHPDLVGLALSPVETVKIAASGRRVVAIGLENAYPLGENLDNLKKFYDLGVRYITLSHVGHNQFCDSANNPWRLSAAENGDTLDAAGIKVLRFAANVETIFSTQQAPPRWNGLSPLGEDLVRRMNRLGVMIDLSHVSDSTFYDVLRLSRAPVLVSHSTCRALCSLARSLSDEQILALRDNGGVLQINALGVYLKYPQAQRLDAEALYRSLGGPDVRRRLFGLLHDDRAAYDSLSAAGAAAVDSLTLRYGRANVADYVDHIDHVVQLAGIDHVGIGTDFDGGGGIQGFDSASDYVNVTEELIRRGYTPEQMEKIWGGNLLRVWSAVEKTAAETGAGR